MAAASLIEPGERVLVCAGPGVVEALAARGRRDRRCRRGRSRARCDAVVVGPAPRLRATPAWTGGPRAARAGARLIATNDDATYPGRARTGRPAPARCWPRWSTASGVDADRSPASRIPRWSTLVRTLAGPDGVAVGDRADTDGRFARALGYRFGLVLTGVTTAPTCRSIRRRTTPRLTWPPWWTSCRVADKGLGASELGTIGPWCWALRSPRVASMADNDFLSRSRDAGGEALQRAQDALEQLANQLQSGVRAAEPRRRDPAQAGSGPGVRAARTRPRRQRPAARVGRVRAALAAVGVADRPVAPRSPAGRAEPPGGGPGSVDQCRPQGGGQARDQAVRQEGPGQAGGRQEDGGQEGPGQEEGCGQAGSGQEEPRPSGLRPRRRRRPSGLRPRSRRPDHTSPQAIRFRPAWWHRDVASTTSWFGATWLRRAPAPRRTSTAGRVLVGGAPADQGVAPRPSRRGHRGHRSTAPGS